MQAAINFFQPFKIFGFWGTLKTDSSERKLSRELIKDARKFFERAEAEARNGSEAEKLLFVGDDQNLKKNLINIAVWHYESAAKNYRQTAARYAESSRIRRDQEKLLIFHSEKNLCAAQNIEETIEFLRSLDK